MKRAYRFIGLAILAVILAKIDFKKLIFCFSELNAGLFLLINLITIPVLLIKAFRWTQILRIQGIDYPVIPSLLSYLGGFCAGIITPGRAGEALRACYLKEEKGVPLSLGLASIFIDRIFDLFVLLALATVGLFSLQGMALSGARIAIFYLSILSLSVVALFRSSSSRVFLKKAFLKIVSFAGVMALEGDLRLFFSSVRSSLASKKIYSVVVLTVFAYVLFYLQACLLAGIAHINLGWMKIVFFVSISGFLSLLPVTVLGLGTREASLVFLFSVSGVEKEAALTYSFLLFLSFYIFTGLIAYAGWLFKNRAKRSICVNE